MILIEPIRFRQRTIMALALTALCLLMFQTAFAQQGGTANYFYDANGRLTAVLSPTGEAAIYNYDPTGNFTSITRRSATTVSIIDFTPGSGGVGTAVTIYGTGFSATPSSNTVKFNGVTATATSTSLTQLIANVPTGATTGTISVTTPNGTTASNNSFVVGANTIYFNSTINFGESITILPYTPCLPGNSAQPSALLTFNGVANQRISIMAEDVDLVSGCMGDTSPYATVKLISPTGAVVAQDNLDKTPLQLPLFAFIGPVSLPASGNFSLSIEPNFSSVGMTVRLYDVAPDISGTIAASGLQTPVSFNSPGQNAVLTFAGLNGQRICLQGTQDVSTLLGTDVKLYAPGAYPNGSPLASATLSQSFFIDLLTLSANGTYTILVDPRFNKVRTATLTLSDVPPDVSGSLTIGAAAQTVTIPSIGQAANLTFSLSTNQTNLTIHIRNNTIGPFGAHSTLTLNTQGGTQVFTKTIDAGVDYDLQPTLTQGTYVLKIDPQETNIGSLSIYLTSP